MCNDANVAQHVSWSGYWEATKATNNELRQKQMPM
jgi:hypothetical protein